MTVLEKKQAEMEAVLKEKLESILLMEKEGRELEAHEEQLGKAIERLRYYQMTAAAPYKKRKESKRRPQS